MAATAWNPIPVLRTPAGAVGFALLLALATLPITIAGVAAIPSMADAGHAVGYDLNDEPFPYIEPAGLTLVTATLVAVVAASLAGGILARRIPVGFSTARFVVAVFASWPVAIVALPVVPALAGWQMDIGAFCIDSCDPLIQATSVVAGGEAYVMSLLGTSLFAVALIPLAIAVAAAAALAGRYRVARVVAMLLLAALLAGVNAWSIMNAPVPFAVLVAGVAVWTLVIRRAEMTVPATTISARDA